MNIIEEEFKEYFFKKESFKDKKILIIYEDRVNYSLIIPYDEVWFINCLDTISLLDFLNIITDIKTYKVMQVISKNYQNLETKLDNLFELPGIKKWSLNLNCWVYFNYSI